jgi:predicted transcriptional regulator
MGMPTRPRPGYQQFPVEIKTDVHRWLKELAKERELPMAALVRQALYDFLRQQQNGAA